MGRFIPYLTCKIRNKDTQYVVLKKHDISYVSCLKSTTYWASLFLILHVKYGIKRPNSLSFFFIILASGLFYTTFDVWKHVPTINSPALHGAVAVALICRSVVSCVLPIKKISAAFLLVQKLLSPELFMVGRAGMHRLTICMYRVSGRKKVYPRNVEKYEFVVVLL